MKTNHYGLPIDSEFPTTGVFNCNNIEYLMEDVESGDTVDLNWEDHKLDCPEYKERGECECEVESDRYLIGFQRDKDGLFEPDPKASYSAIVNFDRNTIQVLMSKWGIRCALCSPCYPGQGDGDTPGKFLAFAPDPDLVGGIVPELRERIFLLREEEDK